MTFHFTTHARDKAAATEAVDRAELPAPVRDFLRTAIANMYDGGEYSVIVEAAGHLDEAPATTGVGSNALIAVRRSLPLA